MNLQLIDCTLRDGGYYNNWDFSRELIGEYLVAMHAAAIDYVELGFRSFETDGFKGACAYTTDNFIRSLAIPAGLNIGVMMNATELVQHKSGALAAAKLQFNHSSESPVSLVRFACHVHEFESILPVCAWLKDIGYKVGINLMQVADRTDEEIESIGKVVAEYSLDALYFADSMGSLEAEQTASIVQILKRYWKGALGIHTHDNMGRAMANVLSAINEGVTWIDSTVTGMGRGPGNVQTEYVLIELESRRKKHINLTPLLVLINKHFKPMQMKCGWGFNPYYYLAGKHGIHPTYIQEMLSDTRFEETEILSVIDHLKAVGGKKFSSETLEAGLQMYGGEPAGNWVPEKVIAGREVLIMGAGPSATAHREEIERVIKERKPYVIALNTQTNIDQSLIDVRAACHPFRLLADCALYPSLPQPLLVPASRLPAAIKELLGTTNILDFGLSVHQGNFQFNSTSAVTPTSLVIAYALAVATSGKASRILLAGFDGYSSDDPRSKEMDELLAIYELSDGSLPLLSITPTRYNIPKTSVYAI